MNNINYQATQFNGAPCVVLNIEGTHKQFAFNFDHSWEADAAIEMLQTLDDVIENAYADDKPQAFHISKDAEKVMIEVSNGSGAYMFRFTEDNVPEAERLADKYAELVMQPF